MPGIFRHPPQPFMGGKQPLRNASINPSAGLGLSQLLASGGLGMGGGAIFSREKVPPTVGGAVTGGAAPAVKGTIFAPTGGMTTGSGAVVRRTLKPAPAGGVVTGGTAPTSTPTLKFATGSGGLATGGTGPANINKFVVGGVKDGFITIAWDVVANATGYKLYYGTTSGGPYNGTGSPQGNSPIDVGNITQFTIHGLTIGQTYYFVLTSYNASGESAFSGELSDKIVTSIFSFGGSAISIQGKNHTPAGGAQMGSAAKFVFARFPRPSGGMTTGGTAPSVKATVSTFTMTASGGLATGGTAPVFGTKPMPKPVGGVITGLGAIISKGLIPITAGGGLVTGGQGLFRRIWSPHPTAGVTTGGSAPSTHTGSGTGQFTMTPSGGAVTGGAAIVRKTKIPLPVGGLVTGGAAAVIVFSQIKYYQASGGLISGGGAQEILQKKFAPSGGLATGGQAQTIFIPVPGQVGTANRKKKSIKIPSYSFSEDA